MFLDRLECVGFRLGVDFGGLVGGFGGEKGEGEFLLFIESFGMGSGRFGFGLGGWNMKAVRKRSGYERRN